MSSGSIRLDGHHLQDFQLRDLRQAIGFASLERIAVGRTTIIIAHRLSTVRHADVIFVVEQGELKENGRHEELCALNNGIYANLWREQTGQAAQKV
ncbi:MAG: hypothetical protein CSA11_07450 [Chloroflexi bacterium]|nr:MAG: hypothetical protein CSA11_07450 [Chloroflexota bacterium]